MASLPGPGYDPCLMKLDDKIILVTGAARRVGSSIATLLAGRGAHVVVHYRSSREEAEQLVKRIEADGGRASVQQADLMRALDIQRMIRNIEVDVGYIDVLVNNASEYYETPLLTTSDEDWERLLRTNLTAPFQLSRRVASTMLNRGGGQIVNIGDLYAERFLARHLAYCVSKAGLLMLTRGLARELAPSIRVNAVSPGAVLFPEDLSEERREQLRRLVPLQREGTPEDVARAVRYLVEDGDYLTGEVIHVDGGRSSG